MNRITVLEENKVFYVVKHNESKENIPLIPGFKHFISKIERRPDRKEVRKRCSGCYEGLRESGFHWEIASKKARKVNTECKMCNKVLCIKCFEKYHS